jgi:uncharacterized protein (DUF2384 family)
MAKTIQLTANQRQGIQGDVDKNSMLTDQELEAIASKLNEHIDIPFVSEEHEQVIWVKIVKQIDRFLYKVLPNEVYQLIRTAQDGISNEEAQLIEQRLAQIINKYVDIPIVSEEVEEKIFTLVLSIIATAMKKGKSLLGLL